MREFVFSLIAEMKQGKKAIPIGFYYSEHIKMLKEYCDDSFELLGSKYFVVNNNVYKLDGRLLVHVGTVEDVVHELEKVSVGLMCPYRRKG